MRLVWGGRLSLPGSRGGGGPPIHRPLSMPGAGAAGGGRQASAVGHHLQGLSGEARARGRRVGSAGGEGPQGPGQVGAVGTKPVVLPWGHRITLSQTSGSSSRNPGSGDLGTPPPASTCPGAAPDHPGFWPFIPEVSASVPTSLPSCVWVSAKDACHCLWCSYQPAWLPLRLLHQLQTQRPHSQMWHPLWVCVDVNSRAGQLRQALGHRRAPNGRRTLRRGASWRRRQGPTAQSVDIFVLWVRGPASVGRDPSDHLTPDATVACARPAPGLGERGQALRHPCSEGWPETCASGAAPGRRESTCVHVTHLYTWSGQASTRRNGVRLHHGAPPALTNHPEAARRHGGNFCYHVKEATEKRHTLYDSNHRTFRKRQKRRWGVKTNAVAWGGVGG